MFFSLKFFLLLSFVVLSNCLQIIEDQKSLKKVFKTNQNVLVMYQKGTSHDGWLDILEKAERETFNKAKIVVVKCQAHKKLCKEVDFDSSNVKLMFYRKDADKFSYNRLKELKSLIRFLEQPSEDVPWDEDPTATVIRHFTTVQEYNRFMSKDKTGAFIMFYAPWCGHCKRLKPEFVALAKEYKQQNEALVFAAVDLHDENLSPLASHYEIKGFPTLLYIVRGQVKYRYDGALSKDAINTWLKNPTTKKKEEDTDWSAEESDVTFLTKETFNETLSSADKALVMLYAPWCSACKSLKPHFTEAATKLKNENPNFLLAAFDPSKDEELIKSFGIKGYPTLKYYERGIYQYDAKVGHSADAILDFTRNPQEPPPPEKPWTEEESDVVHLTDDNFQSFMKKKKYVLVMFYAPWCGHCKATKPEFTKAASALKDNHKVAMAAVDCSTHDTLCTSIGVKGYPTIKLYNYGKLSEYEYKMERDEESFVTFLSDPANPPKPSPLKDWKDVEGVEHILPIDNVNLQSVINQPGRQGVLVMFQAPWCGHCKKMKPAYGAAAKAAAQKKLPIAFGVVDATVERGLSKEYNVNGFPTLIMMTPNGESVNYDGPRTEEGLLDYVTKLVKSSEPPPPPPAPQVVKETKPEEVKKPVEAVKIQEKKTEEVKKIEPIKDVPKPSTPEPVKEVPKAAKQEPVVKEVPKPRTPEPVKEVPKPAKQEPVKEVPKETKPEPVKEAPKATKQEPVVKEAPKETKPEPVKEAPKAAKQEPVVKEAPKETKPEPVKEAVPKATKQEPVKVAPKASTPEPVKEAPKATKQEPVVKEVPKEVKPEPVKEKKVEEKPSKTETVKQQDATKPPASSSNDKKETKKKEEL